MPLRRIPRGRIHAGLDDQCVHTTVMEINGKLTHRVRGVKGDSGRAAFDTNDCCRHLRAARMDNGNPIAAPKARGVECLAEIVHELGQSTVGQRRLTLRDEGRLIGIPFRPVPDHVANRL